MNVIQIISTIMAILIGLWAIYAGCRKKLTLSGLTNVITIYGVVVAIIVLFQFSPQLVDVVPTARLVIHSVIASEELDQYDNAQFRKNRLPAAYCEGWISNIGNALAYTRALQINCGNILSNVEPYRICIVYLFDTSKHLPHMTDFNWRNRADLDWQNQSSQSEYLQKDGLIWTLQLPPIPPNESLFFVIGLRTWDLRTSDEKRIMEAIVDKGLTFKLVESARPPSKQAHVTFGKPTWVKTDEIIYDDKHPTPGNGVPAVPKP